MPEFTLHGVAMRRDAEGVIHISGPVDVRHSKFNDEKADGSVVFCIHDENDNCPSDPDNNPPLEQFQFGKWFRGFSGRKLGAPMLGVQNEEVPDE